jgi:Fe-S cluster biosynthesis and repair protein YggX
MPTVQCSRCGATAEGLAAPPFRGELGVRVTANACAACWKAWVGELTTQMNERRLNLTKPEHQALVRQLLAEFLKLPPA